MNEFEKYPTLAEHIRNIAGQATSIPDWNGFLEKIDKALIEAKSNKANKFIKFRVANEKSIAALKADVVMVADHPACSDVMITVKMGGGIKEYRLARNYTVTSILEQLSD